MLRGVTCRWLALLFALSLSACGFRLAGSYDLPENLSRIYLVTENFSGEQRELECGGLFMAIGHTPNTAFLKGVVELSDSGYVIWKKPFRTDTSVDGIFAAGDVADDAVERVHQRRIEKVFDDHVTVFSKSRGNLDCVHAKDS